jgi:hypothetical protein
MLRKVAEGENKEVNGKEKRESNHSFNSAAVNDRTTKRPNDEDNVFIKEVMCDMLESG